MYPIFRNILLFVLSLTPAAVSAADGNTSETSAINPVAAGLVGLMIVLLFIIGLAARVLLQLTAVYRERIRKERQSIKKVAPALLAAIMLLSTPAIAQDAAATAPAIISGIAATEFYTLIGIIGFELLMLFFLLINIRILLLASTGKAKTEQRAKPVAKPSWLDRFNKSVAIEKEKDIMLDHDYDGIRELDNNLPPWWKYGFYLTIIISVVYLWYYHIASGPSSHEEYIAEVKRGEEAVAAYLAANAGNIDEFNVKIVEDQMEIAGAAKIFQMACAACHANDGGGGIGPNLADKYWLHGGSLSDIFKSIKYGYQDKGMKSWKEDYSPRQIAALATYIMNMQGTTPANPKEPQGSIYNPESDETADDNSGSDAASTEGQSEL